MQNNRINSFILILNLLVSILCYPSNGKLMEDLSKRGYKISFYKTHELLKNRVDTTKAMDNKVIYSKNGNLVYGIIYKVRYFSVSFFHENIKTKKLYYYTLNPFLDISKDPISYDKIVSNIYNCYNIDFNNKIVNEYNVFKNFNDQPHTMVSSCLKGDMRNDTNYILDKVVELPDYHNLNSILNYDMDISKIDFQKKIIKKPEKITNCRPLIFYYFVCLLKTCPIECSEDNFSEVF